MRARVKETNTTLLVGFGMLLVLMGGLIAVSITEILSVRTQLDHVVNQKLVKSQLAQTMFDASRERALLLMMLQYEEDPFEQDELKMRFQSSAEQFMLAREKLFEMELSIEERKALADSVTYAASGAEAMNRLLELMVDDVELGINREEEAAQLMREEIIPARSKVGERMMEIGWMVRESGEQSVAVAEQSYQRTWKLLWLLGGGVLSVSLAIIWVVYRRIMYASYQIHDMYEELDSVASHDDLTGLINRRTFEAKLEQLVQRAQYRGQQMALLYLDLDGFKEINDTLGHHAGDQVLQWVATHFLRQVRDVDTVARLGGDEFVIILNHVRTEARVQEIAQRILDGMSAPVSLEDGLQVQIGVSIGVALYPQNGTDDQTLLRQADRAMYIAKQRGKHSIYFAEGE